MKIRSLAINFSLLFCSLLFVFFACEIFFRVFFPQSGYSLTCASWGWTHLANSRVTYYQETPEFNFDLRRRPHAIPINYNAQGLREFNYGYAKGKDIFRILILGDSFAEDMGSYFENLHAKWLEKKLNGLGYPYRVEVINAGHYAFDNANEYMFYLAEGKKYSPDIVLVMYTGDTASPDYAILENGQLLLRYKQFSFFQKIYRRLVSWVRRNSQFGSFLLDTVTNSGRIKLFLVDRGFKEKDKLVVGPDQLQKPTPFSAVDRAIWLAFKAEIEQNNGKFIFMNCIHRPDEPDKDRLSTEDRKFIVNHKMLLLEVPSTIDASRRLKKEEIRSGIYNKFYDSHRFGYKANEKVADLIAAFLISHKLLPDKL